MAAKKDLTAQDIPTESTVSSPTQPAPEDYSGVYLNVIDKFLYELYKEQEDKETPSKITHKLRVPPQANGHPGFYWEGTKEQFKETFERA